MDMKAFEMVPYIILMLCVSGVLLGAMLVSQAQFGDTITKCYNSSFTYSSTTGKCTNNTASVGAIGQDSLNFSDDYYAIHQGKEGLTAVSKQQSTIAIIGVMIIIISLIVSVVAYFQYFR